MQAGNEKEKGIFYVSGRVQGVGFRYFVYKKAVSLGLTGYAKNLFDGRVEVVAEGDRSSLEKLKSRLQEGPSMSRVERVEADYRPAGNEYSSFEIR